MSYVSGTRNQSALRHHWSVLLGGIAENDEKWRDGLARLGEVWSTQWIQNANSRNEVEHNQGETQTISTPGNSRNWLCSHSALLKRCAIAIKKSSSIYQPWLFLSHMCVKDSFWTCVKMQISIPYSVMKRNPKHKHKWRLILGNHFLCINWSTSIFHACF